VGTPFPLLIFNFGGDLLFKTFIDESSNLDSGVLFISYSLRIVANLYNGDVCSSLPVFINKRIILFL